MSAEELRYILSPRAIRERSQKVFKLSESGGTHFELHLDQLDQTAEFVTTVIRDNYPELKIPYHSRWNHFLAGRIDRVSPLRKKLENLSSEERLRSLLDLVVVSVFLDAGAGAQWNFQSEGKSYNRSEGLALATLEMFTQGLFSSDIQKPFQVDRDGLMQLKEEQLTQGFQVSSENPLVGFDGRYQLLKSLAQAFEFRPSDVFSPLYGKKSLQGVEVLELALRAFNPIWPGRLSFEGEPLGDVWSYEKLGGSNTFENLVPFHKLSQWLSYSIFEPFEWEGVTVTEIDALTGLPEYRNGGLFIDKGVLRLRDVALSHHSHSPSSELVIEWRALTIVLLDLLAGKVRDCIGRPKMTLAQILEGGTWSAGRRIANQLRKNGKPPLEISSDGTVF